MPKNGLFMRFFGCTRWGVGVVGEPRRSTENGGFKPFFVGCAQISSQYKKPAKPFRIWLRGLLHGWGSNGGQDSAEAIQFLKLYFASFASNENQMGLRELLR